MAPMFDAQSHPRVFAQAPGVDFPRALVDGLLDRMASKPPEALGAVHLIVSTRRMARRIRTLFDSGPARLLPRLTLIADLAGPGGAPPLRRRLLLAQMIARLLDAQPDLAARASASDLAQSLSGLFDEMAGEGVAPETIAALDVSDLSGHWARAQQFIGIAETFMQTADPGAEARQRSAVQRLTDRWRETPPLHPVILAGSTGSRGTTQLLMEAVAHLPQGAVVLPGFDPDMPPDVWAHLDEALLAEDHPQFRFRKLMTQLDIKPQDIPDWHRTPPPQPARGALVSLALRPAPVTDAWRGEGPQLPDIGAATAEITLLEAPGPRAEALAIAMRLREAAEHRQSAALITPDRMLTRQVAAALGRWGITPDDSAGQPLHLSPPGRFLRHVCALFIRPLNAETLLTLLKHPLCHTGADRGPHLRLARDLELHMRETGMPFPCADTLLAWAETQNSPEARGWARWVGRICGLNEYAQRPLGHWTARLHQIAEHLGRGDTAADAGGSGTLWQQQAGVKSLSLLNTLAAEAAYGGEMSAQDFADLLHQLLTEEEVRDRDTPHPGIMIWGTLEARVQGADLMILAGLNEGTWPEAARPDPWLNRTLRDRAGLLLPERRIGLAAHDFQMAIAAREVWLTRAKRSDDAETVPSRWLNRLINLMGGLGRNGGPEALREMRARGHLWQRMAETLEDAPPLAPAPRPSPRPPVAARPRRLSVTQIKTLIRDPYAIYARHVLRLRPLGDLLQVPDARLRGIIVHEVMDRFIRAGLDDPAALSHAALMRIAEQVMTDDVPWPAARQLWGARLERAAASILRGEAQRQARARPTAFEERARAEIAPLGFTLTGTADRIDMDTGGNLFIYDYKTGAAPTKPQQARFDKQLLLEAAIAEQAGFGRLAPAPVRLAEFIPLKAGAQPVAAPLEDEPPAKVWAEFTALIAQYLSPDQGFTARRAIERDGFAGDYDQLARFGEWDGTDTAAPEDMT